MRLLSIFFSFSFLALSVVPVGAVDTWVGTDGKAASSQLGQADFSGEVRNRTVAPPADNNMGFAHGVAVDPISGKVFVADPFNHRVLRFASAAALQDGAAAEFAFGQANLMAAVAAAGTTGLNGPKGVSLDGTGTLWVADTGNHRVVGYQNAVSESSAQPAALFIIGQPDAVTTSSGISLDKMNTPLGIFADSTANLWVADSANHRVLFFVRPASEGGGADIVLGNTSTTAPSSGTGAANLYGPSDVTMDGAGTLWVADTFNHRVVRFDDAVQKVSGADADGLLGQPMFGVNTPGVDRDLLSAPTGVSINARGRLFVSDSGNHRVVHFRAAASKADGAAADGVLGDGSFTDGALEPASASSLNDPSSVECDGVGRIWVSDEGNSRVMRYDAKDNSSSILSARRQLLRQKKALKKAKLRKRLAAKKRVKKKIRRLRVQLRTLAIV